MIRAMVAASVLALAQIVPGMAAAVTGMPGSGKTRDAQFASKAWPRYVVFDPYADRDRLNAARGGHETHPWPGQLVDVKRLCSQPSILDAPNLALVVHPVRWWTGTRWAEPLDSEGLGQQFSVLAELCWMTGGGITLVAEEAALYSRASAALGLRIATGGRHGGLSMVALSQAIGRLAIDYRRCMQLFVTGCQNEPNDVKAIRERCGDDFARQCVALPTGAPLLVWKSGAPAQAVPDQDTRGRGRRTRGGST